MECEKGFMKGWRDFPVWFKPLVFISAALLLWAVLAAGQDTNAPTVEFSQARSEVRESDRAATVKIERKGDTNVAITVEVLSIGGSATDRDYSFNPGPITIAAGKREQAISITLHNDAEAREARTLRLALSNPVGARLGDRSVTEVLIVDDDAPKSGWISFGLHRIPFLNRSLAAVPLWQYVASLLYVFLAFAVSKLLDVIVRGRVKTWAARTRNPFDELLLQLVRAPLRIIAFVILLHVGLKVFAWPSWFEQFISRGLVIVVAVSLTYAALRVIEVFSRYWKQRASDADHAFAEQLLPIVRNTLKVFAVIVAVLLTLSNLGINITSLITSLGIGGLALALAAQDTLSNFFGAIVILVDKPFRIGDHILLDKVDGTVEAVGFRSTRVRAADGNLIYIPNKTIGNATITNVARASSIRTVMNLGITYGTSVEKMRKALQIVEEVLKAVPRTKELTVVFNQFGDSAMNIQITHVWDGTDGKVHSENLQNVNLAIKKRFDEEKIEFGLPSRMVYLKNNSEWRLATSKAADEARREQ